MLAGLLCTLDSYYLKTKPAPAISNLLWALREATGFDLVAPVFSNGTILNFKEVSYSNRELSHGVKSDY